MTSTEVRTTTAHSGSVVKYHTGSELMAARKKHLSCHVMLLSAFWAYASQAMYMVISPEMPIGQAPIPPPPLSCARKAMKVVVPHMIHEKTCGLVLFCWMARVYGTKPTNVNAMAMPLRTSRYIMDSNSVWACCFFKVNHADNRREQASGKFTTAWSVRCTPVMGVIVWGASPLYVNPVSASLQKHNY